MNYGVNDGDEPIRIGLFASLLHDRVADALVALGHDWPDVIVGVEEMALAELLSATAAGRITLGIHPGDPGPGASSCVLWHDHALVLLSPAHRLATVAEVTPSMLADEVLLTCRERSHAALHRFLSHRLFAAAPPRARMVPEMRTQAMMDEVANGLGVMLTCGSHVDRVTAPLIVRPIAAPSAPFAVNASWSASGIGPIATALLALLRD
jgi:DNA-binding transcriptional LysR family regulator